MLMTLVGGIFLALSWLIALQPALKLREETLQTLTAQAPQSETVLLGRSIYLAEGCGYCHSQFVRPTLVDLPFGRASTAADYAGQHPPVPGTQRTGPDLSNVGARQPSWMWQFLHLYDPRSMVPQSLMPAYPWYFEIVPEADVAAHQFGSYSFVVPDLPPGSVVVPTRDAMHLITYLRALRQETSND